MEERNIKVLAIWMIAAFVAVGGVNAFLNQSAPDAVDVVEATGTQAGSQLQPVEIKDEPDLNLQAKAMTETAAPEPMLPEPSPASVDDLQYQAPPEPSVAALTRLDADRSQANVAHEAGSPAAAPPSSEPVPKSGPATVAGARTALRARDFEQAAKLLSAPELSDDSEALYLLATLYRIGDGVGRDNERAFELTHRSAMLGNMEAQFSLGRMYLSGRGVEASAADAKAWMAKAAEAGHAGATEALVAVMTGVLKPQAPERQTNPAPVRIQSSDIAKAQGNQPVLEAAARGEVRVLKRMVEAGETLDVRDAEGRTPLMLAAAADHGKAVTVLMEAGVHIAANDAKGMTALIHAAKNGRADTAGLLLAAGAQVRVRDNEGLSATEHAFMAGQCDLGRILLQYHGQVGSQGVTPDALSTALKRCGVKDLLAFQAAGVALDFQDQHERDAIWHAAQSGNAEVVRFLIENGFNPDSTDAGGLSALLTAINGAHEAVALVLVQAGANTNLETSSGNTALLIAATRGLPNVAREILKAGADIDHRNRDGYSALMLASKYGRRAMCELLVKRGADTGLRNKRRERAVDIALAAGHTDLVELIR